MITVCIKMVFEIAYNHILATLHNQLWLLRRCVFFTKDLLSAVKILKWTNLLPATMCLYNWCKKIIKSSQE